VAGRPRCEEEMGQKPKKKVYGTLFTYHDSELTEFLRSRKTSGEETMSCWNGAYSDVLSYYIHYLFLIVNKCHKGSDLTAFF